MWPAVALLSLLCIGNSVAVYVLWKERQRLAALYAEQSDQHIQTLKKLNRRIENYLSGSVRIGEELDELQKNLGPLPEKILRMEQKNPDYLSFTQAARLVGLGATSDDLKQSCGLSQTEADLLQRLHTKR